MNFSDALEHLKKGDAIARCSWGENKLWIAFVITLLVGSQPERKNAILEMKTDDGLFNPWVVSFEDLKADDWTVIEID